MDKAHLRRFDFSIKMPAPNEAVKRRITKRAFNELPVKKYLIDAIATHSSLTPALIEKASKVCRMVGAEDAEQVDTVARQALNEDLRMIRESPLDKCPTKKSHAAPTIPINTSVLNTSLDPDTLVSNLNDSGYGRICFHGLPGTGKTAFAVDIAKRLKRPLHQKQASNILGAFQGQTERNIEEAFADAQEDGAILLLDEIDSFLQSRNDAVRHWHITQVNQFLTSLERFEGYVICTTNLVEKLDHASLRRFDFKVEFRCMDDNQARRMVIMVLKSLGRNRSF